MARPLAGPGRRASFARLRRALGPGTFDITTAAGSIPNGGLTGAGLSAIDSSLLPLTPPPGIGLLGRTDDLACEPSGCLRALGLLDTKPR